MSVNRQVRLRCLSTAITLALIVALAATTAPPPAAAASQNARILKLAKSAQRHARIAKRLAKKAEKLAKKKAQRGPAGADGTPGQKGSPGQNGSPGQSGAPGQNGVTGSTGPIGPIGVTGELGVTGETGPTGVTGEPGDPGPAGVTGDIGETGPTGLDGEEGATGPTGLAGELGPTGVTGATGPLGAAGGALTGTYPDPLLNSGAITSTSQFANGTIPAGRVQATSSSSPPGQLVSLFNGNPIAWLGEITNIGVWDINNFNTLRAPVDGLYAVTASVGINSWDNETSGGIQIMKVGDVLASDAGQAVPGTSGYSALNASTLVQLNAGDRLRVDFVSTPGAGVVTAFGHRTSFTMNWVGPPPIL